MRSRRMGKVFRPEKNDEDLISVSVTEFFLKKEQLYCQYIKQQPNIYYLHIDTINQLQLHSFSCCIIM